MDARTLLTANLALVERAVAYACQRYRLDPDDAEEFAAVVNLKLVENDYSILRQYEERCAFATFISVVVQRMALDYRIHAWGKWHISAEAKRLGPLAMELDQFLNRDGRTLEEAVAVLGSRHEGVTLQSLRQLAERLPRHPPRRYSVPLEESRLVSVARTNAGEERLRARDRRTISERVSTAMAAVMESVPEEDHLILQLRFEGGMAVSQIARTLKIDQRLLYRRLERLMRDMREELERRGLAAPEVLDVIGGDEILVDFDLGNANRRPSIGADETVATNPEVPQ